jgi:MFS family permease
VTAASPPALAGGAPTYSQLLRPGPFRRLWAAQSASAVGDAASEIAVVLLAARLSPGAQAEAIGLAAAAYFLPGVASGVLLAGLIARAPPRALVGLDAAWRAACLAAIVVLASTGGLSLAVYVCLLALASITRPAGLAGERALVKALTTREALLRANALTATSYQLAAIAGPLLAGLGSSLAAPEYVLLFDAGTFAAFAAVAAGLPAARGAVEELDGVPPRSRGRIVSAIAPPLVAAFGLTFAFYLLYGPTVVALPLQAASIADGLGVSGPLMLSLLWAAFGIGGALGALTGGRLPQGNLLRAAVAIVGVWGVATIVVGLSNIAVVALLAMAVGGAAYAPYPALMATILQRETRSERELLRLGSLWASMTSAAAPLGMLVGALVVPSLGPSASLVATGAAMVALCAVITAVAGRVRAS